ncbi:electron transfer flavoprotein subunit alpha/FixB family protein [Peribacillus sp. NPDC058002]|uniref:electron transfer flavoprotein subunit alpha/FixB family protein n=1 Tax=Peribacillus sp. NPDC058002 TaxID=3346301 RepID=UPI0036DFA1A9
MGKSVLVMMEIKDNKLRNVSREILTAANRIAEEIVAVAFGSDIAKHTEELGRYGASKVYTVTNKELDVYTTDAYFQALCQVIDKVQPDAILMPHTAIGKDLAPRIASFYNWGLVSDVIDVQKEGADIIFTRPIYAGKALEKRKVVEGIPFATVRPNNIVAEVTGGSVEKIDFKAEIKNLLTIVKEVIRKTSEGVDLAEAKVVVAGGRGIKSSEGFSLLQDLANVLGGAVGASRGACDAEYCDYSLQIGQTGKVVTPDLYIACGISGAIQHLAGMSSSKVILAINKDPEAPIFQIADYGVVGDLFEVVPLLIEEFKKLQYTTA